MITTAILIEFGFEKKVNGGHDYYELDRYALIPVLGNYWLISSNFNNILTTGDFPVIQTVEELKTHYLVSTKKNLKKRKTDELKDTDRN